MRRVTIITIMRYVAVVMLVLFFWGGTGFAEETEVVPVGPQLPSSQEAPSAQAQPAARITCLPEDQACQSEMSQAAEKQSSSQQPSSQQPASQQPSSQQPASQQPASQQLPGKQLEKQPIRALRPELRAEQLSAFEKYIAGTLSPAVSTNIKQFGYELFRNPPSTFAPVEEVPVGPDYVVGPGDEIRVSIWGKINGQWTATVDRDGNISLPKIGTIGVTGLTFKELKDILQREVSKYYIGIEMNVSMGSLRTIRVYVVGNAMQPGAYTVSSLSTLVNALFESGGPSKTGSMRDIQLKRNGETLVHFDMYDFLLKGDKTKDMRIMPEDVIFIPPVGPLAGIAGNVRNPAIYELKGETKLLDLIDMAGGLTGVAFKGRVQLRRVEDHQFRTIFEGDLVGIHKDSEKNYVLKDGDLVKVFPVVERRDTVVIAGAVAHPGEYGLVQGVTTVKDLISLSGGLLYYASYQAELTRVQVTQQGPRTERFDIDLAKAEENDPKNNIPLQINDYLLVHEVPEWHLYKTVTISGEVKFPGTYTIRKGERLSSLIERAGGYTDRAYLRGAVFTRESVRKIQQRSLDDMIARLQRELFSQSTAIGTAASPEEVQARKAALESSRGFIEQLKKLRATGRMTVSLANVRLLKGSPYDIELEACDTLFIPMENSVVSVVGSVMTEQASFLYVQGLGYQDYVEMSGGYTRYADEDNVYVLKVDGSARKLASGFVTWNSGKSRWEVSAFGEKVKEIEPGDTIIVPEKLEHIAWLREVKDITQILMQMAVTAGVVIKIL
jgi:polysaccharide export outer membrane protein